MTPPRNRIAEPLVHEAERFRLLDSLPEPVLLSMITDRARALDLEWLRAMQSYGLFDAAPATGMTLGALGMAEHQWSGRCQAMLGVMALATLCEESDPHGILPSIRLARFDLPASAKQHFADFCLEIGEQAKKWPLAQPFDNTVAGVMVQAMGLAAMLDRVDVLEAMADSYPQALLLKFREAEIGRKMFSAARSENEDLNVGVLFCAIEFSSPACVRSLAGRMDPALALYSVLTESGGHDISLLESFEDMAHRCTPDVMTPLLKLEISKAKDDPDLSDRLKDIMRNIMRREQGFLCSNNPHLLDAFIAAGVADITPNLSLRQAVSSGWPQMVKHFQDRIDWDHFIHEPTGTGAPVARAIANNAIAGVQALMTLAQSCGRGQSLIDGFVLSEGKLTRDTARHLVHDEAGVFVLGSLFALGLDPDSAVGTTTLRQMAAQSESGAIDVIHSFCARKQAMALIDEMGLDAFSTPKPSLKN